MGDSDGIEEGGKVGDSDGMDDGCELGDPDGMDDSDPDGTEEGLSEGMNEEGGRVTVGAAVGDGVPTTTAVYSYSHTSLPIL